MSNSSPGPTVASLVWDLNSGIHIAQGQVVQQLGYPHIFFEYDNPIPPNANVILIQGPYGSLLPFIRRYSELSENERPVLLYWFQQSLYISMPLWMLNFLGRMYSDAYNYFHPNRLILSIRNLSTKIKPHGGVRFTFFGDIFWLHYHNLIDILATPSSVYQDLFMKFGIDSLIIPRGYHPEYGNLLDLERDIAVLWLGKTRTRRRKKIVYQLREQLDVVGLKMQIHDGLEKPFVFGEERTNLLNRTWFVLNILTSPTDELSIRYFIAAANGAVILTEPGKNEYPFKNGVHLLECPPRQMAHTVRYYIDHPEHWQRISQNAYNLVSQELTLQNSIAAMLKQAEKIINGKKQYRSKNQ